MAREFARKFYHSKEWKRIREIVFQRDNGLCQKCLKEKDEEVPGDEVHHLIWLRPTNINNPNITMNMDNLVLLCRDCHMQIHKASTHKKEGLNMVNNGVYIDNNGEIKKQKVYIVHGAPGSGKTTFVKNNMEAGDLVVDLDLIKQSISMCSKTESPDNLYEVAESIREMLYKMIESKQINAKTIWVVSMLPTRKQRRELSRRLDAELIHMDADIETCIDRVLNDDERLDKEKQMKLLDNYFGYYESPPQNK